MDLKIKKIFSLAIIFFLLMNIFVFAESFYFPYLKGRLRDESEYQTSYSNGKKYYRYEVNYTDRDSNRHNYYEEFHYDNNGRRKYFVQDTYSGNGTRVYIINGHFTEEEYKNDIDKKYSSYYGRDYDYYSPYGYDRRYGYYRHDRFLYDRPESEYKKEWRNNRKYFIYETSYRDSDGRTHYYEEEFYYDADDRRVYYVEEYYYDNGSKVYKYRDSFSEGDYRNYPYYYDKNHRYYKDGFRDNYRWYRYTDGRYYPIYRMDDKYYKTEFKNGKNYYIYETTYIDDSSRTHYFKEEFYYDENNYRQYYVEDYFYSNGGKTYLIKETFDERNKKSYDYYYQPYEENILYNQYFGNGIDTIEKKTNKIIADEVNEKSSTNEKIMAERNTNSSKKVSGYPRVLIMKNGSSKLVRGFENYTSDEVDLTSSVIKKKDSYLVPIALVSENLGILSEYNPNKLKTSLKKGAIEAVIYNNSNDVIVNGKRYNLGVDTEIRNNRVMVPVEILENFGYRNGKELVLNKYLDSITIRN